MCASEVKENNLILYKDGNLQARRQLSCRFEEWIIVQKGEELSAVPEYSEYTTLCMPYWWKISKSTPCYFLPEIWTIPDKTDEYSPHKREKKTTIGYQIYRKRHGGKTFPQVTITLLDKESRLS